MPVTEAVAYAVVVVVVVVGVVVVLLSRGPKDPRDRRIVVSLQETGTPGRDDSRTPTTTRNVSGGRATVPGMDDEINDAMRRHPAGKSKPHTLTVFNAVDVPESIATQIVSMLAAYDVDCYTRPCDADGYPL